MRNVAVLFASALLSACAVPGAHRESDAPVVATNQYYEGTSTGTLPGGRSFPNGAVLARRTLSPREKTIVEHVVSADGRRPATEYEVRMIVSDSTFTMKETSGGFEGSGTLEGAPWSWRVWHSTSRLPDGSRVESADSLVDGGMIARKTVFNRDGGVVVQTVERLNAISAERFAERRRELLGGG